MPRIRARLSQRISRDGGRGRGPAVIEIGPKEIGVINSVDGSVQIRLGSY
ncbi:hypothetical protein [Stenotrophomonas tumulicola]|uniref:Uncharacterized protein n=1 Tax=Stenotrophomonas tumulicola TaxID=1685415 RepID=A0A7W3FIU1_9GAMM|nr:hypothetical protein [Stenotrophomonas tumulicola]MBA8680265.1 hypothetical protein [Stenotrophomonas tumulicola]